MCMPYAMCYALIYSTHWNANNLCSGIWGRNEKEKKIIERKCLQLCSQRLVEDFFFLFFLYFFEKKKELFLLMGPPSPRNGMGAISHKSLRNRIFFLFACYAEINQYAYRRKRHDRILSSVQCYNVYILPHLPISNFLLSIRKIF